MTVNNGLYHFGIRGMHWGVRRFQNEDGSLTSAGKNRYGDGSGSNHSTSDNAGAKKSNGMSKGKKIAIGVGIVAAAAGATLLTMKARPDLVERGRQLISNVRYRAEVAKSTIKNRDFIREESRKSAIRDRAMNMYNNFGENRAYVNPDAFMRDATAWANRRGL